MLPVSVWMTSTEKISRTYSLITASPNTWNYSTEDVLEGERLHFFSSVLPLRFSSFHPLLHRLYEPLHFSIIYLGNLPMLETQQVCKLGNVLPVKWRSIVDFNTFGVPNVAIILSSFFSSTSRFRCHRFDEWGHGIIIDH